MQGQALPGFRDFYPEELAFRNSIFATWREVARRYGFQEYDGPPLEPLELYTEKSGEEIVQQLYAFEDKGGRTVALRPEMTPTLARMVGARAQALKKPLRWFSIPQLFRYERQQRGRLREHFQLNMDIVGASSSLADAEVIAAAIDVVRAFGFGPADIRVRISDREAVTTYLKMHVKIETAAQLTGVLSVFDRYERDKANARAALEDVFRGDNDRIEKTMEVAESLKNGTPNLTNHVPLESELEKPGHISISGQGRLNDCLDHLRAMGLGDYVETDFGIVRGLAYYTGIVFEMFDTAGSMRAICGGGRYDNLLNQIAGVDLPCVGFGMGDVVLGELVKARGAAAVSTQLDAFLVAVSGEDVDPVLRLAHDLRDHGLAVEYGLRHAAVGKQLELAAARGAPRAVILGPEERKAKVAVVRDLQTGKQRKVALTKVRKGVFK